MKLKTKTKNKTIAYLYAALLALTSSHAAAATYNVTNSAQLEAAFNSLASGDIVNVNANITLSNPLNFINLPGGSVTINGNGNTINGNNLYRGFIVFAGNADINNLTIDGAIARGGNGAAGGAGLGGALFVGQNANVTITDVTFNNAVAVGGNGTNPAAGSGGGGMGGNGGIGNVLASAGGGGALVGQNGGTAVVNNIGGAGGGVNGGAGAVASTSAAQPGGVGGGGGGASGGFGIGANGGLGGGGGGGVSGNGGDGGFGGGGASSTGGFGGAGGYAGGSVNNAPTQFASAAGIGGVAATNGAGGSALGGAIFVQQGGTLNIQGNFTEIGSTVTGGTGFNNGSAFGSGMFFSFNGSQEFNPGPGSTQTINDVIGDQTGNGGIFSNAGSWSMVKEGAGTTVFIANNTYSGGTTINDGVLQIQSNANLGTATSPLTINDGILQANASFSLPTTRPVSINSATSGFDVTAGNTLTLDTDVTGAGTLNKTGAGTVRIATNTKSYTGGTNIAAGNFIVGDGGTNGMVTGPITANGNLVFDRSDNITYAGAISGAGTINKINANSLTLTADNPFTGTLTFTGPLNIGNGGSTGSIEGNIVGLTAAPITFNRTTDLVYNGNISGNGTVLKDGPNQLTVTGTNTQATGFTIVEGTLAAGQDSSLGGLSSDVSIANGATFKATNSFAFNNARGVEIGVGGANIDTNGFNLTIVDGISSPTSDSLTKVGTGVLELQGNSITMLGDTFVNAGDLRLNGALGGDITVNVGGTLSGIGTAGANLIANSGSTVSPGNGSGSIGTFNVLGDYTSNPGANYQVELNNAGAVDLINVGGQALLNGGNVTAVPLNDINNQNPYLIIQTTGGVVGTFDSLTIASSLYQGFLSYDPFNVYLTLIRNVLQGAKTHNQIAVQTQLNNLVNPPADVNNVFGVLLNLPLHQYGDALDQLSGAQYANLIQIAQNSAERFVQNVYNAVRNRTFDWDCGCDVNPCELGIRAWFDAEVGKSFQRGDWEAKGYNLHNYSVYGGLEKTFSDAFTVGTLFDYERDNIHFNLHGHGKSNLFNGGLYAIYKTPNYYLFSNLGIGYRQYKIHRHVNFSSVDFHAHAKPSLIQGIWYNEAGITIRCGNCLVAQPFFGVELGRFHRKGFKEKKAGSFNLSVENQTRTTVSSLFGVHLFTMLPYGIQLGADIGWRYRYNLLRDRFHGHFVGFGDDFSIIGPKRCRNSVEGSINFVQNISDNVRIFADVYGERAECYSAIGVNGGFSIDW